MGRNDFQKFLRNLTEGAANGHQRLANRSIEEFLGAASAWVADIDGYFTNRGKPVPTEPS